MEKSERPKASKREDGVDLISNMPDCILLLILSHLPHTEEVIRSSILSRRWSMSTVGRWIHAAVTRNVKELDLGFCPKDITEDVELPHCLVTCNSLKKAEILPELKGNTVSVVLSSGISRVESLSIDLHIFSEWIYAAIDPGLPNLKTLMLKTTMDAFTMDNLNNILKYYPKLKILHLMIELDFHGRYNSLDDAETRRILTRDVKRVEVFEFNGEMPDLFLDWYDDRLEMFYNWWGRKRVLS
ncbi:hypothetical protein L2E82_03879 [Cichorium intybus]|uniref:Uncharacterized protein n=1 Tax=Cichorium intybus TaxID=13427 RepID=A0ACB9H5F4_CICIN|nr:hypothetical protein L2E82_03879 [Cichorium intybus]